MFSRIDGQTYGVAFALAVLSVAAVATVFMTGHVWPHDAMPTAAQPHGWAYPGACCSGNDCADTRSFPVRETPEGYAFTIQPGEHPQVKDQPYSDVIAYGDPRIKDSPDQLFHACISPSLTREPTRTICLFVPPRSF
jgi:hypothetical protein